MLKTIRHFLAMAIALACLATFDRASRAAEESNAGSAKQSAKESAASAKPAADDPFKVPDGSVEALLKYVDGLKQQRPESRDASTVMEFRRKMAKAMTEAADKILAAKPDGEQKARALRLKLEAASLLPLSPDSDKFIARLEELLAQFKQAGMPKEALQATRLLLTCELSMAVTHGPQEVQRAIERIKDFFRSEPVDEASISLALNAGMIAEARGEDGLAVKTYRDLAEIFAAQKDPKVVKAAAMLKGAARRLGLKEKAMIVEGQMLDGKPLDWSKYSGKVVLIDFWATWCGPCRAELPNVKKNYEAYHDRGFEIVGISVDQKREDVEKFLEKEKLPWTIVLDESWRKGKETADESKPAPATPQQMATYYGVFAIPRAILLGKDGKAISLNARGPELGRELEKALGHAEEKN